MIFLGSFNMSIKSSTITLRLLSLLFLCVFTFPIQALTFRRINNASEIQTGLLYLIAGYNPNCPDSVFVMTKQETSGTDVKNRMAIKAKPDSRGRIAYTDTMALFRFQQESSYFYIYDIALDAYLSYSTEYTERYAVLYTLTDNQLSDAPTTNSKKWYKTFTINENYPASSRTLIQTRQGITIPNSKTSQFGMEVDDGNSLFKLYRYENYGDSLFLYIEVIEPRLQINANEDWTFIGDWQADSLSTLDFSTARRIDFSSIDLPDISASDLGGRMPGEYTWTYVNQGDADRLPPGWPNVIQITDKYADIQGEAVSQILGSDSCLLGPKYSFSLPDGTGISWQRSVTDDDGWNSLALPFVADVISWGNPSGPTADIQFMKLQSISSDSIIFSAVDADEALQPLQPCLWRPVESSEGIICFHADQTIVYIGLDTLATSDGFHAAISQINIDTSTSNVFILSEDGNAFVRASAGSWIAPSRAYIVDSDTTQVFKHLVSDTQTTSLASVQHHIDLTMPMPAYRSDGTFAGILPPDGIIPSSWPQGLYITPFGKIIKK